MNFVQRKGTKAAQKLPENFSEIKETFLCKIKEIVSQSNVPNDLIINFDQTNVYIVPVGDYILEDKGSKQIPIIGLEDKRQITVLLGCTLSCRLLPPQVIYTGSTNQVHPKFSFPEGWHITHTQNHWSNSESMCDYINNVIVPYVENVREHLPLSRGDVSALCIFDMFKAHQVSDFKELMTKNNIRMQCVPTGCTSELQPLDLSGNDEFKKHIKNELSNWYAWQVQSELESGKPLEAIQIDLKLSTLNPVHARWLVSAFDSIKSETIKLGPQTSGIYNRLKQ